MTAKLLVEDLISIAAPRHQPTYIHPRTADVEQFGRYGLVRKLGDGDGDQCYLAAHQGHVEYEKHLFLRRFDRALLEQPRIDAIKQHAHAQQRRDIALLYDFGIHDDRGFIVSEYIEGRSLRELEHAAPLPWLAIAALAYDVLGHLRAIHELGIDGGVTPSRVRIARRGDIVLCLGLPGLDRRTYHQISCELLHAILVLAATPEERALLHTLFADDQPDAIWVVSDAIVERHRELDPVLPLVLLAHAGRADPADARTAVAERVTRADLAPLWARVSD